MRAFGGVTDPGDFKFVISPLIFEQASKLILKRLLTMVQPLPFFIDPCEDVQQPQDKHESKGKRT